MVLEMPELFTHEELVREFAKGTKSRMQLESQSFNLTKEESRRDGMEMPTRHGQSLKKLEAFGQNDSIEDMAEEEGNVLLEDAFLSHNVPNRSNAGIESHFGLGISRISNRT